MTEEKKTFIEITNMMIYQEILDLKKHVLHTNGKVKLNKWIATTALSLSLILIPLVTKLFGGK